MTAWRARTRDAARLWLDPRPPAARLAWPAAWLCYLLAPRAAVRALSDARRYG